MGAYLDYPLVQEIIVAIIAVLVYWIKKSIDNHLGDIKTSLVNINNNISNTQIVHVHTYREKVKPDPPEQDDET
ncbi:hypothetical protein KAW18_17855 [candidate division WOR-3 bacterium]|nr:hypothetical protein [candidate division WOR-3 bacterium]